MGGKSAINTKRSKNLIGNFYPPADVLIEISLLQSLRRSEYFGGLLEGLKIMFVANSHLALIFMSNLQSSDYVLPEDLVYETLKEKIKIVEEDEFEQGRRLLLNYGHTFGHALEAATKYETPHGIAIGLGMLAANSLAEMPNGALKSLNQSIRELLLKIPVEEMPNFRNVNW